MSAARHDLELMLDGSQELLMVIDAADLRIRDVNRAALNVLGYARDALLGRPVTDVECALSDAFFWDAVRSGALGDLRDAEGLYRCADGRMVPVRKWVRRVEGAWVVRAVNDGERKQTEAALAQVTSRLRATLEATADGILMLDHRGAVAGMNRHFARLWGCPQALLTADDDARLLAWLGAQVDEAARARFAEVLASPLDEGDGFDTFALQDGRSVECRSRPARHAEQIIGRVHCFTDVTDRLRAERDLIAARDAADAANRAKSDFLAMMSHEIRTPMNGVVGMAALLESTALDDEQLGYCETIRSSANALLGIIDDILDYSKIEARKLALASQPFSFFELMEDLFRLFAARVQDSGVRLVHDLDEAIPPRLVGDAGRLRQILVNLLGNAFKFTPRGQVSVTARLAPPAEGDPDDAVRLEIAVEDTGIGIEPGPLAHIFAPFEQADMSTTRRYGGTGLGLSICRMLVALMDGQIGVDSRPGVGSRFWFRVRLGIDKAATAPEGRDRPGQARPILRRDTRVLVVESNAVNRKVLTRFLDRLGVPDAPVAVDGVAAIAACRAARFDLVFMDTHLPGMDGLETTRRLRAAGVDAHIVGVSADVDDEDREANTRAGMDDCLCKPVSMPALTAVIERWRASHPALGG